MVKRRISLFGATGSIGASTVDLLKRHSDRFEVVTLTANTKAEELAQLARELNAQHVVIRDKDKYNDLKTALAGLPVQAAAGEEALLDAAVRPADVIVMAISGTAGLKPSFAAAGSGAHLALANKESIVCAGSLLMKTAKKAGTTLLPIDSEHNAVAQIIAGRDTSAVCKVTLTASGGPFRTWPLEKIAGATVRDALNHPVWSMGAKISVDCASLMNKGLELIEAQHLFDLKPQQLDVVVHPQSVVHALVEYADGSVLAQMAEPDMRVAISHCLDYPSRLASGVKPLDFAALKTLSFEAADEKRFPALRLAREAMEAGGLTPCALNAANEVAVEAFLREEIPFPVIAAIVEESLAKAADFDLARSTFTFEDVLAADQALRELAVSLLPYYGATSRRVSA